ncbi:proteasome regulatory particle subunit [Tilletia horrida]|uniref:Proteasome regulatory particle subunit n=1 Tax=Tilletia horrida TaxID=155126 RepID=A0AAN6GCK3_9BASI|nr:proteasome regulatory particle subunit [Tilletia horrida]KAK0538024.1 proteasome regulatory particle subunit [Tilletia horrida]KAK0563799.1 proteasome regulatory particle subunit [Tilletia horrida]
MPATAEETAALAGTTVVVHPLVLLSVTDHAARSSSGPRKRVVGVLLGQDNGASINVANSFAVPFEEDERDGKTWFLDHDYIESLMEMFKKVNAREKMVGWYHTGPRLRASDLDINELMKRFIPKPVMVIVDPRQRDVGIPTDAYFAVEEIKDDGTATQKTFMHVPSVIEAEEAEEIGVEHLLRDIRDTTTVGTLSTRVSQQLASLRGLQSRLLEIRDYLASVLQPPAAAASADGTPAAGGATALPINHQIIYNLQDIFNLLPNLNNPETVRSFSVANNDQLLVVYLSSLIRAVIALDNLIANTRKLESQEAEAGAAAAAAAAAAASSKSEKDKDKERGKPEEGGEKKEGASGGNQKP